METFHTQMSYQYDTKTHDAVLIVTLSVTVTPQVGLFFKNRTTKDVVVKYLHAMGVDYVFVNMDANSVSVWIYYYYKILCGVTSLITLACYRVSKC